MTLREKLIEKFPEMEQAPAMFLGCPHTRGYCNYSETLCGKMGGRENLPSGVRICEQCWTQDVAETGSSTTVGKIQDSGERQEFETGAVRDIQKGKGRCDLMPLEVVCKYFKKPIFGLLGMFLKDGNTEHLYECMRLFSSYHGEKTNTVTDCTMFLEVAKHFEEGAEKYGENNWQKGLPVRCYINSAVRHYLKWLRGDKDEPHDRAFVWNLMCCIWEVDYSPRAAETGAEPKMEETENAD